MIKFKVFEGEPILLAGHMKRQFYFHAVLGNNEIVLQSEGYEEPRKAKQTVESIWIACGQSSGLMSVDIPAESLLGHYPVPYTHDSLQ